MSEDRLIYGLHTVRNTLERAPDTLVEIWIQDVGRNPRLADILALAKANGVNVRHVSRNELDQRVQDGRHQGVVALSVNRGSFSETDLEGLVSEHGDALLLLVLDGIQDPHNLGACLRVSDAAGVHAVIAPKDRAVSLTPSARKVASGAAESIPFIQVTNLARTLRYLREQGVWLAGAADNAEKSLYDVDLRGALALVVGAEDKGLRRLTRDHCDYLVKIPMRGVVESVNVSVAAGICLFEAVRQRSAFD